MRTATLDDLLAFNDQLAAMLLAGVPVEAGLGRGGREATAVLQQINASVARRVSQGATLSDALTYDDTIPHAYRCLIQVGLRSGDLTAAIDGRTRLLRSVDSSRHDVWQGMLYPLIVCGLAYLGLIGACLFFVPTLTDVYHTLRLSPGLGLQVLEALHNSLPYWFALLPAIVLVLLAWRLRPTSAASASAWLPGMSQVIYWQSCANFADSLGTLLDTNMPLEQALPVAAGAAGDASLKVAAASLADALRRGPLATEDGVATERLPPFLRWSLSQAAQTTGASQALRMAAKWYRGLAQRRSDQIRVAAPLIACVVLGGGATLLYGLAIFVPVVQMFHQFAL